MTRASVVCLHGIWMPGAELAWLASRLEKDHGFRCHLFGYPSVRATLDENGRRLAGFLAELDEPAVHLIGHSLGGIVALRSLALAPELPVGRVVCLGSPLCGSAAARTLHRRAWARGMLGRSLPEATVDGEAADWATAVTAHRDVGVIAGTRPAGLGRLFAHFDEPSDGTVSVSETRLPGVADHIVLPVSHTGMVFSRRVIDQAAGFLSRGEFSHATQSP